MTLTELKLMAAAARSHGDVDPFIETAAVIVARVRLANLEAASVTPRPQLAGPFWTTWAAANIAREKTARGRKERSATAGR